MKLITLSDKGGYSLLMDPNDISMVERDSYPNGYGGNNPASMVTLKNGHRVLVRESVNEIAVRVEAAEPVA